jgi:ketosteroid isomerase-like protein
MPVTDDIDETTASTIAAVERLDEAIAQRDIDAIMAAMTDDVVFEATSPAPDGTRHDGQVAVRAAMQEFLDNSPQARFDNQELIAWGDRAVLLWTYHWVEADGTPGHVRGVDVMRVRDGKISEALAYVKG